MSLSDEDHFTVNFKNIGDVLENETPCLFALNVQKESTAKKDM